MTDDINNAVDFIYTQGKIHADSKSHLNYLNNFTKALIAKMAINFLAEGKAKSMAQAEAMAYADESYDIHIRGIKEVENTTIAVHWALTSAQERINVWRSTEASNRVMDKAVM
jgi:hypothetical protein